MQYPNRSLATLALAVAAVLLCLALVEVALRITPLERFAVSREILGLPFLAWDAYHGSHLVAGYSSGEVRVNSQGLRGPENDPARPRRIVCMGDSSTFGIWVERSKPESDTRRIHYDSYPEALQRLLDAGGYGDWQVLNAGVPGSTSLHSLRILRRKVLALEPDIVTLRVGMNDHAPPQVISWIREPASPVLRPVFHLLGELRLFQAGLSIFARKTYPPGGRHAIPATEFAQALTTFAELSREYGFHLLLIDYPLGAASNSDPAALKMAHFYGEPGVVALYRTHHRYQEAVRVLATRQRIPLLVTEPRLTGDRNPGFGDDFVHPNAIGMETTAALLYDELVRTGWLGDAAEGELASDPEAHR